MIMIIICRRLFELVFVVSLSIGDLDYSSCHWQLVMIYVGHSCSAPERLSFVVT